MSNTDASQVCLGNTRVCPLGCVEFIYTSVSARYVDRSLDWQRIGNQIDTAFVNARPYFISGHWSWIPGVSYFVASLSWLPKRRRF